MVQSYGCAHALACDIKAVLIKKGMIMIRLIQVLAVFCVLIQPGYAQNINKVEVIHVTDYAFTLNEKQAVSFYFGESQTNYCTVTIYRELVAAGYKVFSSKKNDRSISASCTWNKKETTQSSKHKTSVVLEIIDIDKKKKTASMIVSIKLVEPKRGEYFELFDIELLLKDKYYNALTKKI